MKRAKGSNVVNIERIPKKAGKGVKPPPKKKLGGKSRFVRKAKKK